MKRFTSYGGTYSNARLKTRSLEPPVPLSIQSEKSPKSNNFDGDLRSFNKTSGLCGYKGKSCKRKGTDHNVIHKMNLDA